MYSMCIVIWTVVLSKYWTDIWWQTKWPIKERVGKETFFKKTQELQHIIQNGIMQDNARQTNRNNLRESEVRDHGRGK